MNRPIPGMGTGRDCGDPYGIRTHVNGVRGRCLNHLTKGPYGAPTGTRTRDPLIKSQLLYQLSYWCIPRGPRPRYSKSKNGQSADYPSCWCRHRLIFPGSFPPSIVSTDELNFCVRDGNRWNLIVISTDSSAFTHPQNQTTKCLSTKEHQER